MTVSVHASLGGVAKHMGHRTFGQAIKCKEFERVGGLIAAG